MRILFERRFGSNKDVTKLRQQLLDARNGDGAWGWEKGAPSDALTTGLSIYVLAKVRAGDDSSVFRDARKWLLAPQQSHGSWPEVARNPRIAATPAATFERLARRTRHRQPGPSPETYTIGPPR